MITNIAQLHELAAAYGIATEFWTYDGVLQQVSVPTLQQVLASFDVHVATDEQVANALIKREDDVWLKLLPASVITRDDKDYWLFVHLSDGDQVRVSIEFADGGVQELTQLDNYVPPRSVDGKLIGRATFLIPPHLPLGWHRLHAETGSGRTQSVPLAVTPATIANDGVRRWGLAAQIYSITGPESWGIGDIADLADLGSWIGDNGADFLLINPLHAAESLPPLTPSPYLPSSRSFVNPLYIRPTLVPEFSRLSDEQLITVKLAMKEAAADRDQIDRDISWEDKFIALELIFKAGRSRARQMQFERFVVEHGSALQNFALWSALMEYGRGVLPEGCETIEAENVEKYRAKLADRIEFFAWLQWIADEQLRQTQQLLRESGMEIGLMHDLAVGVHQESADVWANPNLFAKTATVGAPPDMYNARGQNWSQPPMRPDVLEQLAYAPLRQIVRSALKNGGALRIDHVMGLFRLWWIPIGAGAGAGTYVRYNHEAMVGVLALEAALSGALVVGEDLGTVEPWVRSYLRERGLFGTAVTWFEGDENGGLKDPCHYRQHQLATVNTHDLPPSLSYLDGSFLAAMEELDLLDDPQAVKDSHHQQMAAVADVLVDRGLLAPADRDDAKAFLAALHRWAASGAAQYFAVALVDLAGDRERQNIPGTDTEYPNWCQWLRDENGKRVTTDSLTENPDAVALLRSLSEIFG